MGPLIAIAAQLLAGQLQKQKERQQLYLDQLDTNAQRFGGNTDMARVQRGLASIDDQSIPISSAVLGLLGTSDSKPEGSPVSKSLGGGYSPAGLGATGAKLIDNEDPYKTPVLVDTLGSRSPRDSSGWFW